MTADIETKPRSSMAFATVQGLRRFFRSLKRTIHDINLFSACFKSVRFLQKCFNFRRSSRNAHRRVEKTHFRKHIFVKMRGFSLITFFLSNSQLRSKIKKMRLNVTHTMIVSSDPGGPGTTPLKFIFENFHRKNDFQNSN